jgi:hypothetical protein
MGQMIESLTSLPSGSADRLPARYVERIFQRMEDFYGTLWADRYGVFPRDRVMATWAEELGDMTADELRVGIAACRTAKFPPTLPEFRLMCRPPLDAAQAYFEAVEQLERRKHGEDRWSSPVVYWAAAKIGNDIANHTYEQMRSRWAKALDDARKGIASGELPDAVPARLEALPAPGMATVTAEQAHHNVEVIKARMAGLARAKAI